MIVRGLHYVAGAVLGALLLLGLASNGLAQTDALWLKASEAAEITAIAQQNGHVRVIVLFDSPIPRQPAQVGRDQRRQCQGAGGGGPGWHRQPRISAAPPARRKAQGFDRGLDPLPDHAGICRQRIAVGAAGARQRPARNPHQLRPRVADEAHRQRAADRHDGRLYAGRDRRGPGRCRARYRRQVESRVPFRQGGGGGVLLQCLPRRQPVSACAPMETQSQTGAGLRQRRDRQLHQRQHQSLRCMAPTSPASPQA